MALTISYLTSNARTIVKINGAEHNSTTLLSLVKVIRCYDMCRSVFEHIQTHAHTHKSKQNCVRRMQACQLQQKPHMGQSMYNLQSGDRTGSTAPKVPSEWRAAVPSTGGPSVPVSLPSAVLSVSLSLDLITHPLILKLHSHGDSKQMVTSNISIFADQYRCKISSDADSLSLSLSLSRVCACVRACVCERERERERVFLLFSGW